MPTCKNCGDHFPNRKKVDGKVRNLGKREYCLDCSPFGSGNTRQIHEAPEQGVCKHCGKSIDPDKTPGNQTIECSACYQRRRRREKKKELVEMFGGECQDCGYDQCYGALEFHHRDGQEKRFEVSNANGNRSWEELVDEAEKCVLVCANCHRRRHCERCSEGA